MIIAIDLETTGDHAGVHEPVQIAAVPIKPDWTAGGPAFVSLIQPSRPERGDPKAAWVHNLDLTAAPAADKVADRFYEWATGLGQRLTPLAHNWPFECSFLDAWLGPAMRNHLFDARYRDSMALAAAINDKFDNSAKPFSSLSLASLTAALGIVNAKPHDAYNDAICAATVYGALLQQLSSYPTAH